MKHLVRAAIILGGVLFIFFVVLRLVPVTETLKAYGFYQDKDNSAEWASLPLEYADPNSCNTCHQDNSAIWQSSVHASVSCENCHGPGQKHIDTGGSLPINKSAETCTVCHAQLPARPLDFPQVDPKKHSGQLLCITCHNPHDPLAPVKAPLPAQEKAENSPPPSLVVAPPQDSEATPAVPHSLEGRADCLLCHNTGGIKPFPADHEGRSSETCLTCHQGK